MDDLSPEIQKHNNRRNWLLILTISSIVGAFLILLNYAMLNKEPTTASSGVAQVGKVAPDFTLQLFTGEFLQLSRLRGKGVVVNFWASWCVPCRSEMSALNAMYASTNRNEIEFVGVNFWSMTESEGTARNFIEEFSVAYPAGQDKDGNISLDYGVTGIPATFFIDHEGRVLNRWVGALDIGQLESLTHEIIPTR
jgi:peroxiredoxin